MRRVVAAAFMSLDGVMQAPGGPAEDPTGGFDKGGWSATYWDDIMGQAMGESFGQPFDLLLGRKTYDIFAAHWPYVGEGDMVGQAFDACTKYVATRGDRQFTWQNTVALRGDAVAEVTRLKAGDGPTLLTQGSTDFVQSLLTAGLIDSYQLMIFPVVLGKGKRLFGTGTQPQGLNLEKSQVATTGVIMATYVPVGEVPIGDFQMAEPTPAELARRAEMAAEN